MKLRVFDRIVMTVLMLCLIAIAGVAVAAAWDMIPLRFVGDMISSIQFNWLTRAAVTAAGLLLAFLCVKVIFSVPKKVRSSNAMVKSTQEGGIFISIPALSTIAGTVASKMNEVRDMKSMITSRDDGIYMRLRVVFKPEVNVPEASTRLQTDVKQAIENQAGVPVREIRLLVDAFEQPKPVKM